MLQLFGIVMHITAICLPEPHGMMEYWNDGVLGILREIFLISPPRRKERRDYFSFHLPLILQKYGRTGRKANEKQSAYGSI